MENLNNQDSKFQTCGAIYQKLCSICSAPAKYCCPKCSSVSCSLTCSKAHKSKNECDGIRDKAAFVPLDDFKEKNLMSDYHFLEDVERTISNANRAKKNHGLLFYKPINLERLQKTAHNRKTRLEILPIVFSKRKISTTYLRYSDNKIFWRVEWSFPLCNVKYSDERIDEETLLGKCLDKYLLPNSTGGYNESLEYYQSMGHHGVAVLMKNENAPANDLRYYILKQNKSLRVNFKNKRIIEFPTLLIVPKIHLSAYPIFE